jgi:pimeloyl-ACP methyl ester carboxylesterase
MEIVCLHGMGRTRFSMSKLARHLRREGHKVHLFGYQRRASLRGAAAKLAAYLQTRNLHQGGENVGFVGHSAGGVLLRYLAAELPDFRAGRSVALGSPIAGSIIAQHYSQRWLLKLWCGPILHSLHPDEVDKLPPPPCELAAIAGTAKTAFLPAALLMRPIEGGRASDTTVLVEETRMEAIRDWTDVPVVHTLLPGDKTVHALVSRYLEQGNFKA